MDYHGFLALWNKGKNIAGYFHDIDPRFKELRDKLLAYSISDTDKHAVSQLSDDIEILCFSELWCPDCVINLTVAEMVAECSPRIAMRVLGREGHEHVITSFNPEGKAYIPTMIVFSNGKFHGAFVEQPDVLKKQLLECTQSERILAMQNYRGGKYADATAQELIGYFSGGRK